MLSKKMINGLVVVSSSVLFLAACTSNDSTASEQKEEEVKVEETKQEEVQTQEKEAVDKEAIQQAYDAAALKGYWVSRAQLGNLVMQSGMGIPFMPPEGAPQKMAESVGVGMDKLPMNPHLTQAVFASGDPHFIQEQVQGDLSTFRWDAATFDQTIRTSDQAFTIIKELEWAKEFHNKETFMPIDPFLGLMLTAEGKMNTKFALEKLLQDGKGFITSIDGASLKVKDDSVNFYEQAAMLWALSDVVSTLSNEEKFPRYYNEEEGEMFKQATGKVFEGLQTVEPTSNKDNAIALTALEWYASIADDQKDKINELAKTYAANLEGAAYENATDYALAIRGLASSYRITGDSGALDQAVKHYDALKELWDEDAGVYRLGEGEYVYTPYDAGAIIGGLHAIKAIVGPELKDDTLTYEAANRVTVFYNNAVEVSGMQPSGDALKDGEFGRGDTANAEVRYNKETGKWSVTDNHFVTHDNMFLANELIWLLDDKGLIQPFPEIN